MAVGSQFFGLQGKTAIVTGGTRGIGRAMTELFLECGATVIYTGVHPAPEQPISGARYEALDLADKKSVERLCSEVLGVLPRLDILVNNAGIQIRSALEDIRDEDWHRLHTVHLTGPMELMRAAAPRMRSGGWGRVVNIASIWGVISKPTRTSYSAAKTGLIGLTRAAALDLAPDGILVNAVAPGLVNTEMTAASLSPEERRAIMLQIPLGRFADPQEIARVVVSLCSPLNTIITGQTIVVDGGFTIQ